ncbi:MAG: acyl-CoA dehydrogenase family protein, partial [Dehalococcoidia bacterium]
VCRLLAYRVAWMQGQGLVPNKEASMCKLFVTEAQQRLSQVGIKALGLHGQLAEGSKWAPLKGRVEWDYLLMVSATIAGGTSEIQRSVIARRGLGLPRD